MSSVTERSADSGAPPRPRVAPDDPRLLLAHERSAPARSTPLREPVGQTGCRVVELPRITDPRGNLTAIEAGRHVPFDIKRLYYLYDVPGGESRGGHAHLELQQLFIAASGSFDVVVDDGTHRERFFLNRSYYGLYVPRLIWRELDNFSSGSVCLVLASLPYDESDYLRSYGEFQLTVDERAAERHAA
jgi:hypothetical protein